MVFNRNLLFQGFIFRFHVSFRGCTHLFFSHPSRLPSGEDLRGRSETAQLEQASHDQPCGRNSETTVPLPSWSCSCGRPCFCVRTADCCSLAMEQAQRNETVTAHWIWQTLLAASIASKANQHVVAALAHPWSEFWPIYCKQLPSLNLQLLMEMTCWSRCPLEWRKLIKSGRRNPWVPASDCQSKWLPQFMHSSSNGPDCTGIGVITIVVTPFITIGSGSTS